MLYMIVERFRAGDAAAVYRRFAERGRMTPPGLEFIDSWVDESMTRCFQLMRTDDRATIDAWIACWDDLVDFEVWPVVPSAEAAARADARSRSG